MGLGGEKQLYRNLRQLEILQECHDSYATLEHVLSTDSRCTSSADIDVDCSFRPLNSCLSLHAEGRASQILRHTYSRAGDMRDISLAAFLPNLKLRYQGIYGGSRLSNQGRMTLDGQFDG